MDRPQWAYRHGQPAYRWRWRDRAPRVQLHYHTLDVDPEDEDLYFKVGGGPLEDPCYREMMTAARWEHERAIEQRKKLRIENHVRLVNDYLRAKEGRIRLRHAIGDLEFAFEPYRARIIAKISSDDLKKIKERPHDMELSVRNISYNANKILKLVANKVLK